jgi:hypothetical protein
LTVLIPSFVALVACLYFWCSQVYLDSVSVTVYIAHLLCSVCLDLFIHISIFPDRCLCFCPKVYSVSMLTCSGAPVSKFLYPSLLLCHNVPIVPGSATTFVLSGPISLFWCLSWFGCPGLPVFVWGSLNIWNLWSCLALNALLIEWPFSVPVSLHFCH